MKFSGRPGFCPAAESQEVEEESRVRGWEAGFPLQLDSNYRGFAVKGVDAQRWWLLVERRRGEVEDEESGRWSAAGLMLAHSLCCASLSRHGGDIPSDSMLFKGNKSGPRTRQGGGGPEKVRHLFGRCHSSQPPSARRGVCELRQKHPSYPSCCFLARRNRVTCA